MDLCCVSQEVCYGNDRKLKLRPLSQLVDGAEAGRVSLDIK